MTLEIATEDPRARDIVRLLETHLDLMRSISPAESVHALDVEKLRRPDITFWTARQGGALVGCTALKEIVPGHGEIKSMHVYQSARGLGIAGELVKTVLKAACNRNYHRLSLETGSMDPFRPARNLYAAFGFKECSPFGDYREDPHSIFMTLELA